jgi:MoaA/NifB/PqqE/SkfB family radical SAM enzyme
MNDARIKLWNKKPKIISPSKLTQVSGYINQKERSEPYKKQPNFTKDKKILKNSKIIEITTENYFKLPDKEDIIIKYPDSGRKLKDSRKKFIPFTTLSSHLSKLKKSKFKDIPPCIVEEKRIVKNVPELKDEYFVEGVLNYVKIAQDLTLRTKMKRVSCKTCKYNDKCEGVYVDYFRIFGFKEINPIKN